MRKIVIVSILLLAVPAFAQSPGDVNCNGFGYEVTDLILASQLIFQGCSYDSIPLCTLQNGDIDNDGLSLSIADLLALTAHAIGIPVPQFPQNSAADTFRVASAQASPGETLTLPVDLVTADTICAYQFYLVPDEQYVTINTFIPAPGMRVFPQDCSGNLSVSACTLGTMEIPIMFLPGRYHLGNVIVSVDPDINQPVTTSIIFSSDIVHLTYTGLANFGFFEPVLVNSTIVVNPTGINGNADALPGKITLEAYPNPFNAQTTLFITGMTGAEISIFDLTGRRIASLNAENGKVIWDARGLSSGVYFARAYGNDVSNCERLILLK